MNKMQSALERSWIKANFLTWLLTPFSWIYFLVITTRRYLYSKDFLNRYRAPLPVVVVGNLTVGGSGKTPVVVHLANGLKKAGFKPAVISRGYRASAPAYPFLVTPKTEAEEGGDEPKLIARLTGLPVMIGADRKASIERLIADFEVDVIISDDGLQHLGMHRDVEICLSNATIFDNRSLLPAGPYREPVSRLASVDYVLSTGTSAEHGGHTMLLEAGQPKPLSKDSNTNFDSSMGVHLVTGIANPQRFFKTCAELGYFGDQHVFPDHHRFRLDDISFEDALPVLMTEKDAVKCESFASSLHWMLPVSVKLEPELIPLLIERLRKLQNSYD